MNMMTTPTMELLKLPNVRMGKNSTLTEEKLYDDAKRLAWEVATKNPLWTIEVAGHREYHVFADGELLGQIGMEWYGSSTKFFVRNERIGAQGTRKNSYHTDKVDKAMLKVKKTFGRMTLSERMEKAHKQAEGVIDNQGWHINHRMRDHQRPLESGLMKWAKQNADKFHAWLKETHQTEMLDHITKLEEAQADMVTIKEVSDALQNNRTALIVLSDGKYVVKIRDNVQLYDDVTLPDDLRGNLGMLKLVDKEVMVTGIGCRVSEEIFVLILKDENEKTEEA